MVDNADAESDTPGEAPASGSPPPATGPESYRGEERKACKKGMKDYREWKKLATKVPLMGDQFRNSSCDRPPINYEKAYYDGVEQATRE